MLWIAPALTFLSLASLTFLGWGQQLKHQHLLLEQRTEDVCVQAARRLEVFMESHLRVATIFARRWATHEGSDFSRRRFEEFGAVLVDEFPGYFAVGLIPADGSGGWTVPPALPLLEVVTSLERMAVLEQSRMSDGPVLSPPIALEQSRPSVYAVLGLNRDQDFLGYLVVDFRTDALLNDCFHERIRAKYNFLVHDQEQLIFSSSEQLQPIDIMNAPVSRVVDLAIQNRTWQLSMVPREEKAAAFGWAANLALPLLGLFLSVALSCLVFLLLRRMELYRTARDQQTMLSHKVLMAQEEERSRVSRDLHDELGQLLTALRLEMGWLEKKLEKDLAQDPTVFGSTINLVEKATDELRRICKGLRPPMLDDLGLKPALISLLDDFAQRTGLVVERGLRLEDHAQSLSREVSLCAYRVIQESLNNIGRHARARQVRVLADVSDSVLLVEVTDDGVGIDFESRKLEQGSGIEGMTERARLVGGTLLVESEKDQGTRVELRIDLSAVGEGAAI